MSTFRKPFLIISLAATAMTLAVHSAADYSQHPALESFLTDMHSKHGFDKAELRQLFTQVEKKQAILDAIARPAEKTLSWGEYRKIFIQDSRIQGGVKFWQDNAADLERAYERFGVAPEIIVAVLGVETRYGQHAGNYRVADALATLGFDYPPRASFFRKELENFLLLAREQNQEPLSLTGSYAGAMGYGQFMPSSYRAYAVDFDGDDFVDIWQNPADAIGSIANYLARHGWERDQAVATRLRKAQSHKGDVLTKGLKLDHKVADIKAAGFTPQREVDGGKAAMAFRLEGDSGAEFWMGLKNFEAITRYNRSQLYAMAVYQLGEEIRQARLQSLDR